MIITVDEADAFLEADLKTFEDAVNELVSVKLNQNQFDALVSFVYNVGIGNFKKSTLLKMINQSNFTEAAEQFLRWNKAGGKVLKGLENRRKSERELFIKNNE
jgi:lysozyme